MLGWIHSDNDAALERQLHLDFATRGGAAAHSRPFERSAS